MPKKLNVIIVIYNTKLEDSSSFQICLKRINELFITVVDNSTRDDIRTHNKNLSKQYGASYLTEEKNLGLSKAYNLAISHIRKNYTDSKWVITLDQDTILDEVYFSEVNEIIQNSSNNYIYYPTVSSDIGIISPVPMNKYFLKNIDIKVNKDNCIACINSGLLINMELFHYFNYDEALFLDMIDFDLFCQLISKNKIDKIAKMKSTINQEFSGAGFSTFESDHRRFKLYSSDFKVFCSKWRVAKFYMYYVLLKRAVKLMIHHKSIKILSHI